MLIKIQDIYSNIIIHDFKIKSQETIQSIKERLKNNPLLNIKNSKEELLLYSGNNFLQDETQNANKSIHNNIVYIIRNHNNNMMVNIDSLKNIIEKRAVSFAQGIKNKDQNFLFTREDPLFV